MFPTDGAEYLALSEGSALPESDVNHWGHTVLGPHEAHIWTMVTDDIRDPVLLGRYEALLSPDEKVRRDRFAFEKGRREALFARVLVRTTLSRYAPVLPSSWRFEKNRYGKPGVAHPSVYRWLSFNISHADGIVACMVTRHRAVGLDIEDCERQGGRIELADRFFAKSEVEALRALPQGAQRQGFFTYWTLKEAYIKARGMGLSIPLGQFAFRLGGEAIRVAFDPVLNDTESRWQFGLFSPSRRHTGAWAIDRGAGHDVEVSLRSIVPLVCEQRGGSM